MNDAAPSECPDDNALVGFVHRTLEPGALATVEAHLAYCDGCRAIVGQLAQALPPPPAAEPTTLGDPALREATALAIGTQVGRYRVEGRLGAGGMGVVYQALDPALGRSVALKVLRTDDGAGGEGRARLHREAQTMAKLSHPNVVALYELGTHEGQVFLAMELVRGRTLGEWLARRPSTLEILSVFREAGLGLAAAHEAGLVHRDFKPANVLVSDDGRVRVTDFGLARAAATLAPDASGTSMAVGAETITRTGTVIGTPAYMAPEQLSGGLTDPRTDQFAFCVALYEALFGVRPFGGETLAELHAAVKAELIREPARGRAVDSRLRQAIERGLRPEPRDRFPSMRALLAVLDERPRRGWVRWVVAAVLIAAVIVVSTRLWSDDRPSEAPAPVARTELAIAEPAPTPPAAIDAPAAAPTEEPSSPAQPKPEERAAAKPTVKAKKKTGDGLLSLHVTPWGEVTVDGRSIGSANMMDYVVTLGSGRHELVVRHPQLGARTETITIEAGKTVERRLSLR